MKKQAKAFDDKIVVITGASSGIGHALAARFLSEGATVVMADIKAAAQAL